MEALLGSKLQELYEGNASALRVLDANGALGRAGDRGAHRPRVLPARRTHPCPACCADKYELRNRALHVFSEKDRVPTFRCGQAPGGQWLPSAALPLVAAWRRARPSPPQPCCGPPR